MSASERRSPLVRALAAAVVATLVAAGACSDGSTDATGDADTSPSTEPPPRLEFPDPDWRVVDPSAAGFDPAGLDEAAAVADATGSHCLAVARHGELVGEWAFDDFGDDGTMAFFSATKSMVTLLVGIAQADGLLDVHDRASEHVVAWQGTPSEDVTIHDLLANVSGREWSPAIDEALVRAGDPTAYAVGLGQDVAPGERWDYNQSAVQAVMAVLDSALAPTGLDPAEYAQERLLDPIGLTGTWESGPDGNLLAYLGYTGTCDDALRIGHLALALGEWDGEQVVDAELVEEATREPSQSLDRSYGLLWWRNTDGGWVDQHGVQQDAGLAFPGVPDDMFAALGAAGQVVAVFPSSGVVIARLSPVQADRADDGAREVMAAVAAAVDEP